MDHAIEQKNVPEGSRDEGIDLSEFLDLFLHDFPNFGAITCACLQNDRRLGFLARTVHKHFVRANLNKLCGLIALPDELQARSYGKKEG
jgi:hypothetical protein